MAEGDIPSDAPPARQFTLEEKVEILHRQIGELVEVVNQNSDLLGQLIMSLGIVVQERNGQKFMNVAIPNDPRAQGGFIARLVKEVEAIKKQLPASGIVLAKNFGGIK